MKFRQDKVFVILFPSDFFLWSLTQQIIRECSQYLFWFRLSDTKTFVLVIYQFLWRILLTKENMKFFFFSERKLHFKWIKFTFLIDPLRTVTYLNFFRFKFLMRFSRGIHLRWIFLFFFTSSWFSLNRLLIRILLFLYSLSL